jgi:hypothetical protein
MFTSLDSTAAILGAGFSVPAHVPPTNELSQHFLGFHGPYRPTPLRTQQAISDQLRRFWEEVFSYADGKAVPSFEDHFTLLDMTANVGHSLGHYYTPSKLRAIRRMSIHRVFDILDHRFHTSFHIERFLHMLAAGQNSSIVSLNWDVVVENHLQSLNREYHYAIPGNNLYYGEPDSSTFPLIKLHGAANWHYCDSCQTVLFGPSGAGKTALHSLTFLEWRDFESLGEPEAAEEIRTTKPPMSCPRCHSPHVTARVATFSYAKAFDFFPFHASWNAALQRLLAAERWIFIGYSLPEADFAFRQLLKVSQMTSHDHGKKDIHVVLYNDVPACERFRRFFGLDEAVIYQGGLESWVDNFLPAPRAAATSAV